MYLTALAVKGLMDSPQNIILNNINMLFIQLKDVIAANKGYNKLILADGPMACSYCGRLEATWEPGGACVPYGRKKGFGQFCSETCFAAGRRAAFKRARTCDWCRHIHPSMNKDFQVC